LKSCHSHGYLRTSLDSRPSSLTPPPPPPPLPEDYSQPLYLKQVSSSNSKPTQKYSRSSTSNLYLEPDVLKQKNWSSAGDLMKKSQEELMSLLIQLRREQTNVLSTCDKLRSQMELEAKLIEIEPRRRDEHRLRFKEFKEKLCNAEKDFENRFQFIGMVDDILRMNYINPKSSLEPENQYSADRNESDSIDIGTQQAKAASTSLSDKISESTESSTGSLDKTDQFEMSQNSPLRSKSYVPDQVAKEQERLIQILEQDKNILEKTLAGVVTSLSNLSTSGDDQHSIVYSSGVEKMKQQQKVLESELSRVRELLLHSAQKLEERAAENVKYEQDMQLARSQLTQTLSSASAITSQADGNIILEEQLANIDQAIDNLNAKRQEILENFRKAKDTSLMSSPIEPNESMMSGDKKKSPKSNELDQSMSLSKNDDVVIYSDDNEASRVKNVNIRMDQDSINNGVKVNLKSNNSNHVLCNAIQEQNNFQQFPFSFSKTVRLVKRESEKRRSGQLAKLSSSLSAEEGRSEFKLGANGFNRARSLVRSASSEDVKSLEKDWQTGPQRVRH
jgi:dihydrolipoyllysine-residue acetyltransferase component of pyruvate dehydrogenase complex, mitochondrial